MWAHWFACAFFLCAKVDGLQQHAWYGMIFNLHKKKSKKSEIVLILYPHTYAFAFLQVQAGAREQSVDRKTRRRTLHRIYSESLSRSDGENVQSLCVLFC